MTLIYSLNENNFLQSLLFNASTSIRIKKQRRKSYLINIGMMICLSALSFFIPDHILMYYFLICTVLVICLFPFYQKWRYKRHYTKFIKDTYKNRIDIPATLAFNEDYIMCDDSSGTSKINISELEHIYETGQYFFLKLNSGSAFIIPKSKIDTVGYLDKELKIIADKLKIGFTTDLNWQWK